MRTLLILLATAFALSAQSPAPISTGPADPSPSTCAVNLGGNLYIQTTTKHHWTCMGTPGSTGTWVDVTPAGTVDPSVVQLIANNPVRLASSVGIKCDYNGTTGTDDNAAIRAALTAGYSVLMPDGKSCLVNNSSYTAITISGLKWYSAGRTTLVYTTNANPGIPLNATNVIIDGIAFDYQTRATSRLNCPVPFWIQSGTNIIASNDSILASGCSATQLQLVNNMQISNLSIPNQGTVFADGLHIENSSGISVNGAYINTSVTGDDGIATHCFTSTGTCPTAAFGNISNVVVNAGAKCFSISGEHGVSYSNATCLGASDEGIQVYSDNASYSGGAAADIPPDQISFHGVQLYNTGNGTGVSGGTAAVEVDNAVHVELDNITSDGGHGTCFYENDGQTTKTAAVIIRGFDCRNAATGQGFQGAAGLSLSCSDCTATDIGYTGFSSVIPNTVAHNITVTRADKSSSDTLKRTVDLEGITGTLDVDGVRIIDDQTTTTGSQFFTSGNTATGMIQNVRGKFTSGTLLYFNFNSDSSIVKRNLYSTAAYQPACGTNIPGLTWFTTTGIMSTCQSTTYGYAYVPANSPFSIALDNSGAADNLNTAAGTTGDWIHFGDATTGNIVRSSSGGSVISTYTLIGSGTLSTYSGDARTLTWTSGTPTASSTSNGLGIYTASSSGTSGWSVTVPASPAIHTAKLYVGTYGLVDGILTLHFSDTSFPDYSVVVHGVGGASKDSTFTIGYHAATLASTMTMSWTYAGGGAGNVALAGVTYQ